VFFFVPQGLVVTELSSRFPQEGGIYQWTKRALGERHGYVCGWCYWINNVLYYPNLLISTAVIATYAFGRGDSALQSNWVYVLSVTIAVLWFAAALNIVGLGTGKWLQNLGGIGTYVPGLILVGLALWGLASGTPPANPITRETIAPDLTDLSSLNLWASIAFAFAGLELSATMADEVERPDRNLPRAIYISAPLIALAYILGTLAVVQLVPTSGINIVSGFLQAIDAGTNRISPSLWWVAPVAAAAYTIGNVGGVGAWLTGPARVAFVIGIDRYFPPAFGRVHPRWHTPYVAILVQASLATVFLLVSILGKGSTVEHAYLILLDTQLLVYFIPYLYLFSSFILHRMRDQSARQAPDAIVRAPGGAVGTWLIGGCGFVITAFAMIVAAIPPSDTPSKALFMLKVVGGAGVFLLVGGIVYWRGATRAPVR